MKKFHSSIKYKLYEQYSKNAHWDLELAIGRYGDLPKWVRSGIKNIVGFDIDRNALYDGEQFMMNMIASGHFKKKDVPNVYANWTQMHQKDITPKIDELNKHFKLKVKENYFDVVNCNFALHFFLETPETFQQFIDNVKKYLKKGGHFVATTSDGQKTMDLLTLNKIEKGQTLDINKSGNTIFSFQRLYDDPPEGHLLETGQEVAVFVDSIGGHNKEYLVNLKYVEDIFKKNGFKKVSITPFEKYFGSFKLKSKMSKQEKLFSFNNVSLVFQKK